MPQLVQKPITWGDVRKGDLINGAKIDWMDKKQTWGTFMFEGDDENMKLRKRLGDSVVVEREELTTEEIEERKRDMIRETLVEDLVSLLKRTPTRMLEEIIDKARSAGVEYDVLNWSNLPSVLQAQALHKIAVRIRSILMRDGKPVNVEDATYDQIVDAFAAWYADEVDRGERYLAVVRDPLSRSTSTISNMLEDLDEWAKYSILSRFSMAMAHTAIVKRAAELRAEWDKRNR